MIQFPSRRNGRRSALAFLVLSITTVGSDGSRNLADELASSEVASYLIQHGAPQGLADAVNHAALDGTQVIFHRLLH